MEDFIFQTRYLNPLTDFGFHKLFGNEACKDLLIDFLNEVIKEEGLITDIQYIPPEQFGETQTDRRAIFDIFCRNEQGDFFIVEMQKAKQPYFRDRSLFYASLPIRNQALQGIWDYRLKAVYLVAVLDFVLFDEFEEDKNHVIERAHLVRERTKTLYSKKLNFVFVELPKFRKTIEELTTNADKWLFTFKNLSRLRDRPLALQGRIFEKLFQLAEIKQLTKEDMETYRKSVLEYQDVRDAVDLARDEGRDEGREEGIGKGIEKGIEKEKLLIIQKCLERNMPIEDIIYLTDFTKEQINKYKDR
jgi:predicted transposase/invertase (TIGR01784 family)